MKKIIKKDSKYVDINFWYYDDEKSFVPLFAIFGNKLSRDEENVLTIMRATNPDRVKKVKAAIVFNK